MASLVPTTWLRLLTHRRSRGILVPARVAAWIRKANTLRAAGAWQDAAELYARAVGAQPGLAHIWIQLGHACKENGRLADAAAAYARAAEAASEGAEPYIHLGQISKQIGNLPSAARHYLEALRHQPSSLAAATELMLCVDPRHPEDAALVAEAAHMLNMAIPAPQTQQRSLGASPRIYCDVSDLLSYFSHARLPTGIQRVQIELVTAMLRTPGAEEVRPCCFADARRGWTELPREKFLEVAAAAVTSADRDDPEWRRVVISATIGLAADTPIRFADGDTLLNVGTSWSERNYFLHLRNARTEASLAYVALVFDLIPMFAPQWFPASLVRDYRNWLDTLVDHADGYIAISEATRADLLKAPGLDAPVAVVPLDADFGTSHDLTPDSAALGAHGLESGKFVVMVSTIEPRKNHIGALDAWLELARTLPERDVPPLVCVGGRGWMNDHVHARIAAHPLLQRKVRLLHGVSDAELALFYRECLFTLYPSFYEGWGLPVTESLCHGKIPVVSRTSALPEAAGRFGIYFDPALPGDLARVIRPLLTDTVSRKEREQDIRILFRPKPWGELGKAVLVQARWMARRSHAMHDMVMVAGTRYIFAAEVPPGRIAGERFRTGNGWRAPTATGTGLAGDVSTLRFSVAPTASPAMLMLRLANSGDAPAAYSVANAGGRVAKGILASRGSSWAMITLTPTDGHQEIAITLGDPVGLPASVDLVETLLVRSSGHLPSADNIAATKFEDASTQHQA